MENSNEFDNITQYTFLKQLYYDNHYGIAIFDTQGFTLIKVNSKYLEIMGLPMNKNYAGLKIKEFEPDFEGSEFEKKMNSIIQKGETAYLSEHEGLVGGMKGKYWENSITPIIVDGKVKFVVSLLVDVTERVVNRKKLEEQKGLFEAILDNAYENIFAIDPNGNFLFSNNSIIKEVPRKITSIDEVYKVKYYSLDGDEINAEKSIINYIKNGHCIKDKVIITRVGESEYYLLCSGNPIYDKYGRYVYGIISFCDITAVVKNQQILKEKQRLLINMEREKNEVLENTIKFKDEFLYMITHEFKTPLTVIKSALQTMDLLCKNQMPEKANKFIKSIKQNANRQLRLVNNLLDITRITSGNIKLNMGVYDIVYLTQSIVNSISTYTEQKGVNLTLTSAYIRKEILVDEEKFERIFLNILSNALKFTPSGKSIKIYIGEKTHKNKKMVSISIKDEGIGIPKGKQKHIFDCFGQADTSLSRQAEGTGIGLHLVKLFIDAMGGDVILKSKEGKGSTFTLLFSDGNTMPLDMTAVNSENQRKQVPKDSRVIESVAAEFSDIYF